MLSKLRGKVDQYLQDIAKIFIRIGLSANEITFLGFLLAILAPVYAWYSRDPVGTSILILASAFLDAVDGSIARMTKHVSIAGAYMDSVLDRISDIIYFVSLIVLGLNPLMVVLATGLAVTISYTKARADSLGIKERKGVGLMERGDRILWLFVILVVSKFSLALSEILLLLLILLEIYTIIERSHTYVKEAKTMSTS